MPAITAALVNELRIKTGQGMMECKKILTETDGDVEKAIDLFRKRGVKTSVLERVTSEGRVHAVTAPDNQAAVAVEILCNTDFTAKSEVVDELVNQGVSKLLGGVASLADDAEFKALLTAAAQKTGENVQLGRALAVRGSFCGSYLYSTAGKGKVAVLIQFDKPVDAQSVKNLGMHIVAAKPVALSRESMPADLVAREREIAVEQAKATGKPQQIAEKIAEGKLNAFFAERVLGDQVYFDSEVFDGKVADYLKKLGATVQAFHRLEVGQN